MHVAAGAEQLAAASQVNVAIGAPVSKSCNLLAIRPQRRCPNAKIRWTVEAAHDSRQP